MSENRNWADLDLKTIDRINALQEEITDSKGRSVVLVAYDRNCGCGGGCSCR